MVERQRIMITARGTRRVRLKVSVLRHVRVLNVTASLTRPGLSTQVYGNRA